MPINSNLYVATNEENKPNNEPKKNSYSEESIRKTAAEFEALMLSQLTNALSPSKDEDDDSNIFGNDGISLPQQMFGEQMGSALAKGGGVGIAKLLLPSMLPKKKNVSNFDKVADAIANIRIDASSPSSLDKSKDVKISFDKNFLDTKNISRPREVSRFEPIRFVKAATDSQNKIVQNQFLTKENEKVTRPRRVFDPQERASIEDTKTPIVESVVNGRAIVKLPLAFSPSKQNIAYTENSEFIPAIKHSHPRLSKSTSKSTIPLQFGPEKLDKMVQPQKISSFSPIKKRNSVDKIITAASTTHDLDPYLVAAVIKQESGFQQHAVSKVGASGYMQLMPATFKRFANQGKNIFDPEENINAGVAYLRFLSNKYNGNVDKVLAGYNSGEGNVDKYGGIPPFRETKNFVASVKKHYRDLVASVDSPTPSLTTVAFRSGGPK